MRTALTILKTIAIVAAVVITDALVVFVEFAGSRWVLPWIQKGLLLVMIAIPVLALLAIIRPLRFVSSSGLKLCGLFWLVSILASLFVVEADLGGLFGIVIALVSGGIVIPPLAVLTMIVQAQWAPLLSFGIELAAFIFTMFLASLCMPSDQ